VAYLTVLGNPVYTNKGNLNNSTVYRLICERGIVLCQSTVFLRKHLDFGFRCYKTRGAVCMWKATGLLQWFSRCDSCPYLL